MKPCPICQITHCAHERKFYLFGLTKILIVQKSLDATITLFAKLMAFLPLPADMAYKINLTEEDLRKCQGRMVDLRKWIENKATS